MEITNGNTSFCCVFHFSFVQSVYMAKFMLDSNSKQVAQWATIAHLRASIMFGDTIIYNALRQITLNLKQ